MASAPGPRSAPALPRHPLLTAIVVAHAAALFTWSLFRHHTFGSTSDLGAYHSVFWSFAHRGTPWNAVERVHQWSIHLEIGLAWLWLPYKIYPHPIWLFLTQAIGCAAAAYPVEALARKITADRLVSTLCAVAVLLTPQLLLAEIADFHAATLCVLPMAIVAWGIEADSPRAVAAGAVAALSLREHMGLLLVAAGLAWVIRHGMRRAAAGLTLAVFGAAYFVLAVKWVIPAFGGGQTFHTATEYMRLGGSTDGALQTVSKSPLKLFSLAFQGHRKIFALELAAGGLPLLFLSLRSLRRSAWPLLLAAPLLAVQLLSDDPAKWSIASHYGAPLVPLFAAACVLSLHFLSPKSDARPLFAAAWLAIGLMFDAKVIPSPRNHGGAFDRTFEDTPRYAALREALGRLPPAASISAQDDVVPHVAARAEVHEWPDGEATDEYVLLDVNGLSRHNRHDELVAAFKKLRGSTEFQVLVSRAGVLLVKRVPEGITSPVAP
jgi:uncharacterized membrane protein